MKNELISGIVNFAQISDFDIQLAFHREITRKVLGSNGFSNLQICLRNIFSFHLIQLRFQKQKTFCQIIDFNRLHTIFNLLDFIEERNLNEGKMNLVFHNWLLCGTEVLHIHHYLGDVVFELKSKERNFSENKEEEPFGLTCPEEAVADLVDRVWLEFPFEKNWIAFFRHSLGIRRWRAKLRIILWANVFVAEQPRFHFHFFL